MLKDWGGQKVTLAVGIGILAAIVSTFAFLNLRPKVQSSPSSQSVLPAEKSATERDSVVALGRLEPEGEVIKLSAPTSFGSARIKELRVKEGQTVQVGQIIALTDNYETRLAELAQAEAQVREAESRLAQVKAGAKQGDIKAQQAAVTRIRAEAREELTVQQAAIARQESELRVAWREYQRYQTLFREGAISASALDAKRLELETAAARLREAKAELRRIAASAQEQAKQAQGSLESVSEVRPTDIQQAQAQVQVSQANLQRAQAELENAVVRSPLAGKVLKIHAKAGETVGNEGVAELGQTARMYAVAQVDARSIDRVKVGQSALVTSTAFPKGITGRVHQVGYRIGKNDITNTDPAADTDLRVVEVRIALDSSQEIANLTNLEVLVKILPSQQP